MKKIIILCAMAMSMASALAQTVIDNFTVGPYVVDYRGEGDIKYRLRDGIDLYEFFELDKDTVKVAQVIREVETPVDHAILVSGYVGANLYMAKIFGVSGVWKQYLGHNLYANGGLSLEIGHRDYKGHDKRNMFEFGIPLQIEWGKLNHQKGTLYGAFGLAPTIYATMMAKHWNGKEYEESPKDQKKSGFLITPSLEFGGNVPVGKVIMRIGVFGEYKINCTPGSYDVYKRSLGRCFLGAKIGVIL